MDGVYYRSDGLKMCLHVKELVSMSWVETRKGVRMRTLGKKIIHMCSLKSGFTLW